MDGLPPFHLAIRVRDLTEARKFYGQLLGCEEGRSSESWVDFNFFGHQLVCHVAENYPSVSEGASNAVDGHDVQFHTSAQSWKYLISKSFQET